MSLSSFYSLKAEDLFLGANQLLGERSSFFSLPVCTPFHHLSSHHLLLNVDHGQRGLLPCASIKTRGKGTIASGDNHVLKRHTVVLHAYLISKYFDDRFGATSTWKICHPSCIKFFFETIKMFSVSHKQGITRKFGSLGKDTSFGGNNITFLSFMM